MSKRRGVVDRVARTVARRSSGRQPGAGMSRSLTCLLALPTIPLPMAKAATGKAPDTAMAGSHHMPRVQAAEAPAVHPPPERHSRVVELRTTTTSHLLPAQLLAQSRRSSGGRPEHLWCEARRYLGRRRLQQGRRGRALRASSGGCHAHTWGLQDANSQNSRRGRGRSSSITISNLLQTIRKNQAETC
jgi:hypothetical protein